ncbi:MAG: hypothetical protein FJ405_00520 [Verrucomicrobia bacterium]|nr:hypothetical protein [Verrucomicrobiota bacterium]
MKRLLLLTTLLTGAVALPSLAQQVSPVWIQGYNDGVTRNIAPGDKLPILVQNMTPGAAEAFDGNSPIDGYSGLIRYDDTRLLLGVRENGIVADAGNATAAEYPDRSLIWIDANTGKALGIAWKEDIFPADKIGHDVTAPDKGQQLSKTQAFWRWGISGGAVGQRALYTAYKHLILRYAQKPDGSGWETTPTIAYEEQVPGVGDGLSGTGTRSGEAGSWAGWRFRDFRVYGSGNDTTIIAGGGTWRIGMHPQKLITEDGGLTFKPALRLNDRDGGRRNAFSQGGLTSSGVKYGFDPSNPDVEVYYHSRYPGTGWEARPSRFVHDPVNPLPSPDYNQQPDVSLLNVVDGEVGGLPAFSWDAAGLNGKPIDHNVDGLTRYDGNWVQTLESHKDLDYIVTYAIPSWNNQFGGIRKPGWLGVHRLNGAISDNSAYKVNVTEIDEIPATSSLMYDPWVEIYPDTTAPANLKKSEILVTFGNGGFGRFTIQNVAPSIVADPANLTAFEFTSGSLTADIAGSPNTYQWVKDGVDLADDGSRLTGTKSRTLNFNPFTSADAGKYKLKVSNPLGNLETAEATIVVNPFTEVNVAASAMGGVATSSSTGWGGVPERINDGNVSGNWGDNSVAHSGPQNVGEPNPSFEIEFAAVESIGRVQFWKRTDCCPDQGQDVLFSLLDSSRNVLWSYQAVGVAPRPLAINLATAVNAKIVRIERQSPNGGHIYLTGAELQAFRPYGATVNASVVTNPSNQTAPESDTATFGPVAATVNGGPQDRLTYQWQKDGVDIPGATGVTYTTPRLKSSDNGAKYRCLFVLSGSATPSSEATLTVTEETVAPTVNGITFAGGRQLNAMVSFSELLDPATAETVANYVFANGVAVTSATLVRSYSDAGGTYGSNVVLTLTGLPMNTAYSVSISGVLDLGNNPMAAVTLTGNCGFYEINAAIAGTATSTSVDYGGVPERANDGNTNGDWGAGSTTHNRGEPNPYVQIDLPAPTEIGRVNFWRRTDCCDDRNVDVLISILDGGGATIWQFQQQAAMPTPNPLAVNIAPAVVGSAIRIERVSEGNVILSVAELEAILPYVNVSIEPTAVPVDKITVQSTTATFGPVAATVVGAPQDRLSFQWQVGGVDIPGATRPTYTTDLLTLADNGKVFSVKYMLSGVSVTRSATLTVNQDLVPPQVASHGAIAQNVSILFNELMGASAGSAANYTLAGGTVNSAQLMADGKTVVLAVSGLGANYSVNVLAGVTDLAGNPIAPVTLTGASVVAYTVSTIGANGTGDIYTSGGGVFGVRRSGGAGRYKNEGDDIQFAHNLVTGDFDKVIKLNQLDAGSRAGLMARATLDAVSRVVKLVAFDDAVALANRIVFDWDDNGTVGTTPTVYDQQGAIGGLKEVLKNRSQWLRLKRTGQSFHAYVSDGSRPWAKVFSKYSVDMPEQMHVGFYAGNNAADAAAHAVLSDYGDYVATGDTVAPWVVSAGSWDKKRVGVKFSEQIAGASVAAGNFTLSEGAVAKAWVGINGDSVYLDVTGVTADSFTVTATGVRDLGGNVMSGSQSATVAITGWQAADEGVFKDPADRPQRGDDPGIVGSSTFLASGNQVEVDYIGGGYNNFNGDRNHFVYKPVSGDFDWAVECTRFDKTDQLAGWGNGGLTVASGLYATVDGDGNPVEPNTDRATRAPRYSAITYTFGSANGNHRALNTWRDAVGGGQGNNGGPGFGTPDVNGFVGKFGTYTRYINSAGEPLANTRADQNPWLRLVRVGNKVTGYWSLFGNTWQLIDGDGREMPNIPNNAVIGWMCMTDAGSYGNQKPNHYVAVNLRNFGPYASLLDVRIHPTANGVELLFKGGKLQSANDLNGPWTDVPGGNLSPISLSADAAVAKYFRVAGN